MSCLVSELRRAQAFAQRAHGDQMHGDRPYMAHLVEVAQVLMDSGIDENREMILAAILHDVVEDTEITIGEVEDMFGERVADLVWAVTGIGKSRRERNASMYRKIARVTGAPILKTCDRIANMEFCAQSGSERHARMYLSEHSTFRTNVAAAIPEYLLDRLDLAALDLKSLLQ